jgi:hypothetical protein
MSSERKCPSGGLLLASFLVPLMWGAWVLLFKMKHRLDVVETRITVLEGQK